MIECKTADDVRRLARHTAKLRKIGYVGRPQPAKVAEKPPIVVVTPERPRPYPVKRITPHADDIIGAVCQFYGKTPTNVMSCRRGDDIIQARQICFFLMRELTFLTCLQIAQAVRRRDHTAVVHACNKIGKLVQTDARLRDEIEILKLKIAEIHQARNGVTSQ